MPLLIFAFFLLLLPQPAAAAAPDLLSFASSLAAEGDHYRAITEYKRFLHYHPDDPRGPRAQLGIARSLLAGQRWQQGDTALEKVWQRYPDSPEARTARQLHAQAAFDREDFAATRQRYQTLKMLYPADQTESDYQIGRSYLEEGRIPEAAQSFAALPDAEARQLQNFVEDFQQLPRKSPALAGSLSALLPGAGQLYTGRPKQAATAFALNAAFIYGAIEAWNNENYTVAGILSLFEIGWYGGNIYNAMNNAHKINRQREDRLKQQLLQRGGLSLGLRNQAPWLQARFRF